MKRFLRIFLVFLVVVLSAQALLLLILLPQKQLIVRVEERSFLEKLAFFQNNFESFDTVFFGSSRTFRNIDVEDFNHLTGRQAFNFGVDGMGTPRHLNIIRILLENTSYLDDKCLVIEIAPWDSIGNQYENPFYFPIPDSELVPFYFFPEIPISQRLEGFAGFLLNRAKRLVDLPYLAWRRGPLPPPSSYRWVATSGYYCLDDEWKDELLQKNTPAPGPFQLRRDRFLARSDPNQNRKVPFRFVQGKENPPYRGFLEIEALARSQGCRVLFHLQPRHPDSFIPIMEQYFLLPQGRVINFCDPQAFPQFYQPENCFDSGHLNRRGARLMSQLIADKIQGQEP